MSKIYVNIEVLKSALQDMGVLNKCPHILNDAGLSAEEIASKLTVQELSTVLENKENVFAIQVWTDDDINTSAVDMGVVLDEKQKERIKKDAQPLLEDCSDNWEKLNTIVREYADNKS